MTICYANFGNLKRTHLINLLYPPKTMQSFLSFNACSYQGIKHNHKNMNSVWCISKDINRYIAEQHADGWANYPLFFGLTLRKTIKTYTNLYGGAYLRASSRTTAWPAWLLICLLLCSWTTCASSETPLISLWSILLPLIKAVENSKADSCSRNGIQAKPQSLST